MSEPTCAHTVVDADGIEEPCGLPVSEWRYYDEGYEHDPCLERVCSRHGQWPLTVRIDGLLRDVREGVRLKVERDIVVACREVVAEVDAIEVKPRVGPFMRAEMTGARMLAKRLIKDIGHD